MAARLALFLTVILFQIQELAANYQAEISLKMDRNKALFGHSFLNISGLTMDKCLEHCLKNCLCLSFQICDDTTECQLCSIDKYLRPRAIQPSQGCTNYDFGRQEDTEVDNQQCGHYSGVIFNCCITSNPCLNGGTCLPPLPSNKKRFRCQCPDGFEGERCDKMCKPGYKGRHCDQPIRSCRGYGNRSRVPGNYTVFDVNNNTFEVFCDFDRNSSMTWTLIQSYSFNNNEIFSRTPLFKDSPQNQTTPSWFRYRLSKSRMESIQQDSTKWRATCRYETDGVLYTDYLRISNKKLNILTDLGEQCVNVEYINVRGQNCTGCAAYIRQDRFKLLHFLSDIAPGNCDFKPFGEQKCLPHRPGFIAGYYFGHYYCTNTDHRCSSSDEATTQTWLGAEN